MNDFVRLLELSGIKLLLEEMTLAQAQGIFKHYGAKDADLASDKLRSTWIRMVQQLHPDKTGGDAQPLALVNAAYDVLKSTSVDVRPMGKSQTPIWQTDPTSPSSIARNDYTDVNFFKKRMYELSGTDTSRWTIYAFDGKFFRNIVTVLASHKIFSEMAEAMVEYNSHGSNSYNTRAVFVQEEHNPDIILIWLDGKNIRPPIPMEHESANKNPANDRKFVENLPQVLDQISTGKD